MHSSSESRSPLDPRLSRLLGNLRTRVRRYVVWDSVLAVAAVLLSGFWLGLALDYLPVTMGGTEMPWLARLILLGVVAAIVIAIIAKMLVGRLRRPLPDDSLALLVERHHPDLGGRLVTAVQLNQPNRTGDSHSRELLRQVHDQAAAAIDRVDPARVFRLQPLVRKALVAGPLLLLAIAMFVWSPQVLARAASRLTLLSNDPWPRRAQLEMVGLELPEITASDEESPMPILVEFDENKIARLPKGSSAALRIRAKADGDAELPVVCTVYYQTVPGMESRAGVQAASSGQSNMRRVGRVVDGFQSFLLDGPPLASLSESVEIDVRGLDARLDGYRIEAVTPPVITDMQVAVRYPEYLRSVEPADSNSFDRLTAYQSGLRLAEGSEVTLVATSSVPMGDTDVLVASTSDRTVPFQIQYSDDRRELRLTMDDFTSATTVAIVPRDVDGISAQAPYRYFLGIVLDEPPELEMKLVGIDAAITAVAKIPVKAKVEDDYGVERLTISATPSSPSTATSQPQLGDEAPDASKTAVVSPPVDRDGNASAEIDLRDLIADGMLEPLEPGDAINIIGEASDRYDLNAPHLTRGEVYRLQIVTPEKLLALMERRELALRARLEQTIDETRNLRESLSLVQRGFESSNQPPGSQQGDAPKVDAPEVGEQSTGDATEQTRENQVRRLRVQQSGLQASKTSEELSGIAASLDDILLEIINNRVDSADRRERIGTGVRDPLSQIVDGSLTELREQITEIERAIGDDQQAQQNAATAVATAEDVLLQLTAVLEKMLDLESYNEILDMVRDLIEDQGKLLEDTKSERKKSVRSLFE